jgi:hypothetical protein
MRWQENEEGLKCPKCNTPTEQLINTVADVEYVEGERCPRGCFKILHEY